MTLHLPRGRTMSSGPRRNFRNMGFHFLTPIFHFLSKPEPNAKLVAYSMITRTWARKTHFDKNPKNFLRQNAKTQLSLSKLSFDKKYWQIFFEVSIFKWTPETQDKARYYVKENFPPLPVSSFSMHLTGADSDTRVKFYPPPASCTILAHLLFTVG